MSDLQYAVVQSAKAVEGWSTVRLPFEPRGWLRDYRAELREALLSLRAGPRDVLVAEYATPNDDDIDLENILLYNLGTGAYAALAHSGLVCHRSQSPDERHHVSYEVGPAPSDPEELQLFAGATIATVAFDGVVTGDRAAKWWATVRPVIDVRSSAVPINRFAVSISLGPAWSRRSTASLVKPMLDGIVASLHVHDGSSRSHVIDVLGGFETGEGWWEALIDPSTAVLGARQLVRPHGAGIAWNPADELCGAFRVTRDDLQIEGFKAVVSTLG